METFKDAAKANKGKMLYSYSDVSDGIQQRLAEFMGITEDALPTLRAIVPAGMKKYISDTKPADLTVDIITKFVDDVLAGKIAPSLKSEPIPEKNDEPVKVIVWKAIRRYCEGPNQGCIRQVLRSMVRTLQEARRPMG